MRSSIAHEWTVLHSERHHSEVKLMRRVATSAVLIIAIAVPAFAKKFKGSSTLKDSQPSGHVDKQHKNQTYDLSFDAEGKSYTCRTSYKKSMNATDFVVGSKINYEIDNQKVKIKTPENKEVQCQVVRVAQAGAATPAAQ
jgi:hypothetical protein